MCDVGVRVAKLSFRWCKAASHCSWDEREYDGKAFARLLDG